MADQAKLKPETNEIELEGKVKVKAKSTGGILIILPAKDKEGKDAEKEAWLNEAPQDIFDKVEKGDKIKVKAVQTNRGYAYVELIDHQKAERDEGNKIDDYLKWAHANGLQSINTEILTHEFEKYILYKATATFKDNKTFVGHGDAIVEGPCTNTEKGEFSMKMHYIRFAETRAIARALRFASDEIEEKAKSEDKKK